MSYIKQMNNKECNEAISRVLKNIDLIEIENFIAGIDCMSEIRKKFYKRLIEQRYEIIKKCITIYNK